MTLVGYLLGQGVERLPKPLKPVSQVVHLTDSQARGRALVGVGRHTRTKLMVSSFKEPIADLLQLCGNLTHAG